MEFKKQNRGSKGKNKGKSRGENKTKLERETNQKKLLIIGNKLRVAGGGWDGGQDNWVIGIKKGM